MYQQLQVIDPNRRNRAGLPAHCYVRFNGVETPKKVRTKLSLKNILEKITRPGGVVAQQAILNNWNVTHEEARVNLFADAIDDAPKIIEFYKLGISPVHIAYSRFIMHRE